MTAGFELWSQFGIRSDESGKTGRPNKSAEDRLEVEITIAQVHDEHSLLRELTSVQRECLECQKVGRNRVRAERVEHEHVVMVVRRLSQRQAAVSEDHTNLGLCVLQVGEV